MLGRYCNRGRKIDGDMPSAPKKLKASTSAVLANEARRSNARVCHEASEVNPNKARLDRLGCRSCHVLKA